MILRGIVTLMQHKGVKSLLDCNKVVTHLDQGLWKDAEFE
jgi:hypothetical protein